MQDTLGAKVKQIHDAFEARANKLLAHREITLSQVLVLDYLLAHQDEIVIAKDLEQAFRLKHPTVLGILRRLEAKGMISSAPNPQDMRSRIIQLVDPQKAAEHAPQDRKAMEESLVKGLTPEEIETLYTLLDKVLYNLTHD